MQPTELDVNGSKYRIYDDENSIKFHAEHIPHFALRRVFGLTVGTAKTIDFADLSGFWDIDSLWISSPAASDIFVEIIDQNGVAFYAETFARTTTPRNFPTVLVNNTLTMRVTAQRSPIGLLLLYLKPAHLAYSKDF